MRIFSRGMVMVDIAPGRQDVQAVCMILPSRIAAAPRSTMSRPAFERGASGTMNPKVFGSHIPESRGAGAAVFEGTPAGRVLLQRRGRRGARPEHCGLAVGNAVRADVVGDSRRRIAMEIQHRFPCLGKGIRIFDSEAVFQPPIIEDAQPLRQRHLLRMRHSRRIQHGGIDQTDGADDQGIAFPMAHRKAHRQR